MNQNVKKIYCGLFGGPWGGGVFNDQTPQCHHVPSPRKDPVLYTSCGRAGIDIRGTWLPNHFVPLVQYDAFDTGSPINISDSPRHGAITL